jgi:PAS domain S-box-containing protein
VRRHILETGEPWADGLACLAATVPPSPPRSRVRPLSETGEIIGLIAVASDITERKQAEEALRESEEKFSSLYSSMTEGVGIGRPIYDDSGKIVDLVIEDVNPAWQSIMGIPRRQVIGKTVKELFGTLADQNLEVAARVVSSGQAGSFEMYWERAQKYFHIIIFPTSGDKLAALFEDITERKEAEDALRDSEERLRRACAAGRIGIYEYSHGHRVRGSNSRSFRPGAGHAANLNKWKTWFIQTTRRMTVRRADRGAR